MLRVWLAAIGGATIPEVEHLLIYVGEHATAIPDPPRGLRVVEMPRQEPFSIGHCHNMGARLANTEWIMKIDVDTLPSLLFFKHLRDDLLRQAGPREWFNCGMIYFKKVFSDSLLVPPRVPCGPAIHHMVCQNAKVYSVGYPLPAATNFICRTQDYLDLGGCDTRFNGYGWEDYQQIYMLERYQQAKDPLPGPVMDHNVTQRCRDEISRRKALELFRRNETYCLFHRWHKPSPKDPRLMAQNKAILLEWIEKSRGN